MTPIHDLLSRIRWDKEYGRGRFEIGFYDRHADAVQRVALVDVEFPEGGGRTFQFNDETGQARRVPFHRIREVYRDGECIWRRDSGRMEAICES
jgi:uncharacterized protein (UPF0248 family)